MLIVGLTNILVLLTYTVYAVHYNGVYTRIVIFLSIYWQAEILLTPLDCYCEALINCEETH